MVAQFELFDIDNPCIGVCQSNQKGYCVGCLRSREERALWFRMSADEKRVVLRLLYLRGKKLKKAKPDDQFALDFSHLNPEPMALF